MTKLELVEKAINFAMGDLCDGCPLCGEDNMDADDNADCRGKMLRDFIEQHKSEFGCGDDNG